MADANWYWAEGANRNGPVAGGAIARLVADGKLGPDDLIWKEGMPDWVAVRKVPALMKYVQVPAGAALQALPPAAEAGGDPNEPQLAAAVQPIRRIQPVGYYNPAGSLPPRAAGTLARHARPRGDVGDWPLDDAQVARFDEALKLRKRIDSAASLFRLMMLLMTIADVVVVIAAVVAMASARAAPGPFGLGMAVGAAFCIALTALYFFAWKATARSHAWAPLTMGILFVLGGFANLFQIATNSANNPSAGAASFGAGVSLLFAAAFAFISFNGFFAIPKYLRQPAWCQELLSKTGQK